LRIGITWSKALTVTAMMLLSAWSISTSYAAKKMTGQDVLDRARKAFDALSGFSANITEQFRWQLTETTTETHGSMTYRKDDRFRLEFPEQRLIVDGKTLYRYNADTNQLLIETYNDESGVILPKQLLSGFSTRWELQNSGDPANRDSVGYQLELIPKEQDSMFRHVTVWIDPEDWFVKQAVVDDVQGNRTEYHIDHIMVNPVLPDSLFTMKVPKGTETIDLR
jgi:outer membrane lipoprotein-sorting protein